MRVSIMCVSIKHSSDEDADELCLIESSSELCLIEKCDETLHPMQSQPSLCGETMRIVRVDLFLSF